MGDFQTHRMSFEADNSGLARHLREDHGTNLDGVRLASDAGTWSVLDRIHTGAHVGSAFDGEEKDASLGTTTAWSVTYISKDPVLVGVRRESQYGPRERSARAHRDELVTGGYEDVALIKTTIIREKIQ